MFMVTGIHLAKILQIILQCCSIYNLFVKACKLVNLCSFISFESDVMNYLAVMTQCRVMADRGDFCQSDYCRGRPIGFSLYFTNVLC